MCVTLEAVHNGSISLLTALRALTFNPSKILDLEAGQLLSGRDADFILFDLEVAGYIDQKTSTVNVKTVRLTADRSKDGF